MERREFMQQSSRFMAAGALLATATSSAEAHTNTSSNWLSGSPDNVLRPDFTGPMVQTVTVQKNGKPVRIHAICTGTVAVTKAFRRATGGPFRQVVMLLDTHFTEFMPVWVWVIEHPEGIIVVDTGENSDVLLPTYQDRVPALDRYASHKTSRFEITREQEIDRQLAQLGIAPSQIRFVVLTHLHIDHTDGLRHFPNNEIIVAALEAKQPYHNQPQLYPTWFKPHLVDYRTDRVDAFDMATPLTDAGDVLLVATPGHTRHHSSVLFQADEAHYLFAGDMSYNQQQVVVGELAGVNANQRRAAASYRAVKQYARQHPLVYLPSHDADAATRLVNRQTLQISDL